ncbi:hypothetical protein LCGC14_1290990 [marine sediment metagenome]|uniref:Uncharacterized protein n=1 Tax=marine sediment metagenome TaxID=412755 RepID=A0A0F9NVC2_9ZZZZ
MEERIGGGRYCSRHGEWLANAHMDICSQCAKEKEEELLKECPEWIKDLAAELKNHRSKENPHDN